MCENDQHAPDPLCRVLNLPNRKVSGQFFRDLSEFAQHSLYVLLICHLIAKLSFRG